ncbi:MAG: ATP-binding protein [Polyangiaceae bacterium]
MKEPDSISQIRVPQLTRLRALIVEDNPDDAELLLRALRKAGVDVQYQRVQTASEMRDALANREWDIVLSDYHMPRFSASEALKLLQDSGLGIPFIIISGTIGEDVAVEALKVGASDFLVKGRLVRLVPSIQRALFDAEVFRERRRVEQALKESEIQYRRIVETTLEGIWIVDQRGVTQYANATFAAMLQTTPELLEGRPLMEFFPPEWHERALNRFEEIRNGKVNRYEIPLVRADGTDLWARLSTSLMTDDGGVADGVLAMVTDLTDHRKLQAQLMVADRMASVGLLAAGVAHEINNPLAVNIANLELVLRDLPELLGDSPKAHMVLEEVQDALDAAQRVSRIVRDLKVFSRADSEERGAVDIHQVLDSSARLAWNVVRHHAVLTKDFAPDLPPVYANEPRLGQVFLNLIVNAAQAIPEGSVSKNSIVLHTHRRRDGKVVVEIRDSGCGMPPNVLAQLFTPFFTTKPVGLGTGLGLSICHRIISSLKGQIDVESELDRGTTFRIVLPSLREVATQSVTSNAPESATPRLLVIDSDKSVGDSIYGVLRGAFRISVLTDAVAAARLLGTARFDLVLCELQLMSDVESPLHGMLSSYLEERRLIALAPIDTLQAPDAGDDIGLQMLEKPINPERLELLTASIVHSLRGESP